MADAFRAGKALVGQPLLHTVFILQRRRGMRRIAVGKQLMRAAGHHGIQHLTQLFEKGLATLMSQKGGEIGNFVKAAGQRVGLRIRQHLQPVLDLAQMVVTGGQGGLLVGADPAAGRQAGQRVEERAAGAGVAAMLAASAVE